MDYQTNRRENGTFPTVRDEPLDQTFSLGKRSDDGNETRKAPRKTTKEDPTSTAEQFTDPPQALQIRLPRDLCKSLKLMSIQEGRSISSIVFDCLTTQQMASKCWIHRKGGTDAA